MQLFQVLCQLTLLFNVAICVPVTTKITTKITTTTKPTTKPTTTKPTTTKPTTKTTTATSTTTTTSTQANPLAPARLESIKDSYSELNLLSKTNPSDFIFDFGNATTGISNGTGGHSVAATVSISTSTLF
jgi:hypothetical protein